MSQATAWIDDSLDFELCTGDGEPLDSERHGLQMSIFASLVRMGMRERGKEDFYVGTDMFVYYSVQQAKAIAKDPKTREHFKGPDVFFVDGVSGHQRDYWVVWEEDGHYPDLVLELLSPSTGRYDQAGKKDFYARTFRTPEYFHYRPGAAELDGYSLRSSGYSRIRPDASGRLWSRKLELALGVWEGVYEGRDGLWLRLFGEDGRLVQTPEEAMALERDRERRRADEAEAEAARLRALLGER